MMLEGLQATMNDDYWTSSKLNTEKYRPVSYCPWLPIPTLHGTRAGTRN